MIGTSNVVLGGILQVPSLYLNPDHTDVSFNIRHAEQVKHQTTRESITNKLAAHKNPSRDIPTAPDEVVQRQVSTGR